MNHFNSDIIREGTSLPIPTSHRAMLSLESRNETNVFLSNTVFLLGIVPLVHCQTSPFPRLRLVDVNTRNIHGAGQSFPLGSEGSPICSLSEASPSSSPMSVAP